MSMKPACPREKSPVKPFSKFIDTATSAKIAPFLITVISMFHCDVIGISVSPKYTRTRNTKMAAAL